jgi:spermidine synthase
MLDYPKVRLYISALISGAAIMVLEVLGTRLIEPFLSSSIFTWIGMISVMLTCLSIGYYLGGKAADKNPSYGELALLFIFSGFSVALIPLISYPVLDFSSIFGIMYGPILASLVLFSIPSVLLAMISPYLIKLSAKNLRVVGQIAGNLYAISTVGSILGTLLAGFYLIPNFGIRPIFFSLSILLILNSILFIGKKGLFIVAIGLIVNVLVPQPVNFKPSPGQTLLYEHYSPYQYMRVVDLPDNAMRVISTSAYSYQTRISLNPKDPLLDYQKYQKLIYVLKPDIKNALFIGLGGGAMPMDMHRKTDANITVVEIDQQIVDVAKEYFNFSEDEGMRTEVADGRIFLKNSNEKYDYIVVDAYLAIIPPFHLTTMEFVEELKSHLNPGGIVFINLISPVEGRNSELFKSLLKVYGNSFSNVYIFPVGQNYTEDGNVVMLATDSDYGSRADFISIINQRSSDNATRELATHYYDKYVDTSSAVLFTDDFCPVEIEGIRAMR